MNEELKKMLISLGMDPEADDEKTREFISVAENIGRIPAEYREKITVEQDYRTAKLDAREIKIVDDENRVIEFSVSSEYPVERWFGMEILSHRKADVDMTRINDGAAIRDEHWGDQIGVSEKGWIKDKKLYTRARFSKDNPRAEIVYNDIKNGIRRNVSVLPMPTGPGILEKVEKENGKKTYRFAWQPVHVAIVPDPADPTVGVGRSERHSEKMELDIIRPPERSLKLNSKSLKSKTINGEKKMNSELRKILVGLGMPEEFDDEQARAYMEQPSVVAKMARGINPRTEPVKGNPEPKIDAGDIRAKELQRISSIQSIQKKFDLSDEMTEDAINRGIEVTDFNQSVLVELEKRGKAVKVSRSESFIGMNGNEIRQYSLLRALNAALTGKWDGAGLEREASEAAIKQYRMDPRGQFVIPYDVMRGENGAYRPIPGLHPMGRTLNVTTAADGGDLVATNLLAASLIELLRNKMVVLQAGATELPGLVGNVAIPKVTGGATSYWIAEDTDIDAESDQQFGQVLLSPKTLGAYTDISRLLMLQSSIAIENFVRMDLMRTIALALDLAALTGDGTLGEPEGILEMDDVNSLNLGANGAALTWANIVAFESEIAADNADVATMAYLFNAVTRGKLKTTEKATSTAQFIWENIGGPGRGQVNGYPALATNQLPSDLTKGTGTALSAAIFGNFADLLIGLWGGLDVLVDTSTNSLKGGVRIVVFKTADIAARHEESFCICDHIVTT